MTVNELYLKGEKLLKQKLIENASFDCDCLFDHFVGYDKAKRIAHGSQPVPELKEKAFLNAVDKRLNNEPLQYILGKWEFMGIEFSVGPGVLIPRPETELLVETAFEYLKSNKNAVIYDLCAGSGAIGLSLAKLFPDCYVYLFEKYEEAFVYLKNNAAALKADNVKLIQRDIFDGVCEDIDKPDIILSNPPYIKSDEISSLQKEVGFEPSTALDGGRDGLEFYRCIRDKWFKHIKKGGFLAVECGEEQSEDIVSIFSQDDINAVLIKDFNNIDRVVRLNV